jgi:O-acetyl-ADP-ribose deacetylase (regulator of RNase III)
MEIEYKTGDATAPIGAGTKIIVHVCNDIGAWGRGFVMAVSKRWSEPERRYRAWHTGEAERPFALGEVQFVEVGENIWVANLIGQKDIRASPGVPPVRYKAIRAGLKKVTVEAKRLNASAHMPRIGCGLAGGDWSVIASIIQDELLSAGVQVTVYDLPT